MLAVISTKGHAPSPTKKVWRIKIVQFLFTKNLRFYS